VRFFSEEGFSTPRSRIAENFDRMLADPLCWSALAADGEAAQAVITVSTVLYVEWGRLGEIGDLYVLPGHRRNGLARRLVEHAKAWCRAQGCSAVSVTITPAGERRHRLQSLLHQTRLRTVRSNKRLGNTARLIVRSLSRPIHNGLLFDACTGAGIANDHERPHY
jgi:GNAT superfamily N-acetyltransferase